MAHDRRGAVWRRLHGSKRVTIASYFLIFASQIILYTAIFHYAYPILEEKPISWPTSLLFVLETITTVGYGELLPFSNQVTILITILMMITGIILIFMIIPLLLIPYLGSLFQASPPRKISHEVRDHVVIIGYGPLTRALVDSLLVSGLPLVLVVDKKEVAFELSGLFGKQAYVIWGDYHNAATWSHAWVKYARHVVVCEEERLTASIVLGIRELTDATVVAVVDKLTFERYLRFAGADVVLSPKHVTGQILARHVALTSHVDTLIEETMPNGNGGGLKASPDNTLRIINIPILHGSSAAGRRLGDLELFSRYEADCLLLSRRGHYVLYPGPDEVLDTSTMLFLVTRMSRIQEMVEHDFMPREREGTLAVITGFGDVGGAAYEELTALGVRCIVIDRKSHPISTVVGGNAEDEETLQLAQIDKADFCIVALNDDALNIFTTLMARNLNPRLRILARANEPSSVERLSRAGADYVALLPSIGGQVIAGVLMADTVYIILNLPNGQIVIRRRSLKEESVPVRWVEKTTGVKVLGIEGSDRSVIRPGPEEQIRCQDMLIAVGYPRELKRLIGILKK